MHTSMKIKGGRLGLAWHHFTRRKTRGEIAFDIFNFILITTFCALVVYPFLYMISVSFSDYTKVSEVRLLPKGFNIVAYAYVFALDNVKTGYINSIVYTTCGVAISMVMTVLCAYPLSKSWLPGRKAVNIFILITMYFGGGLVPTYLLVSALHLRNTMWALILPGCLGTYNMIVLRTYFQSSIPQDLEDAANIDGAGPLATLLKIYLPLSKPILATLTLFYLVGLWNAWFPASIYLNDSAKYPIQLVMRNAMTTGGNAFLGDAGAGAAAAVGALGGRPVNQYTMNYALTVAVILPVLVIYPFCQKYFVKGIMVGSLKG